MAAELRAMDWVTGGGNISPEGTETQSDTGGSSKPVDMKNLDPSEFGLGQAKTATEAVTPPMRPPTGADFWKALVNPFSATANAIPRGVFGGRTVDAVEAATQIPQRMLYGDKPGPQEPGLYGPQQPQGFRFASPNQAYDEALARQRQMNQTVSGSAPIADVGGKLTGGLLSGAMAAPSLGWGAGTGILGKLGQGVSYLGRNAGFGGAMSQADYGDPGTGAVIGSLAPLLHMGGTAAWQLPKWAIPKIRQAGGNQNAQATAVGRTLADRVGGSPIETSPVGPLSLAEATNNPQVAAYGDVAKDFDATSYANLRQSQQDAVNDWITRHIAPPGKAPDATARLTGTVRQADEMAGRQESKLWNVAPLQAEKIPTAPLVRDMKAAVQNLPPGLGLGVTGNVRRALDLLENMPNLATVADLNSVSTALRLAGRATQDNPWAAAVGPQLREAFINSMDRSLSGPNVNPAVLSSWRIARDFTRSAFGDTSPLSTTAMAAVTDASKPASEVSRGLFNFSFGSPEGPTSIADLAQFTRALHEPGAGPLSDQMIQAARSYLASGMRDAGRLNPGENFNPKTLQDFIRDNEGWMKTSGILQPQQHAAVGELSNYIDMLRRPDQLMRQVNSATSSRTTRKETFIDQIMTPWARKLLELGGIGAGGGHAGGAGALVGAAVGAGAEGMITTAERTMREMMAQALLDPQVARGLMTQANAANYKLLSPKAREAIQTLRGALTVPAVQAGSQPEEGTQ